MPVSCPLRNFEETPQYDHHHASPSMCWQRSPPATGTNLSTRPPVPLRHNRSHGRSRQVEKRILIQDTSPFVVQEPQPRQFTKNDTTRYNYLQGNVLFHFCHQK